MDNWIKREIKSCEEKLERLRSSETRDQYKKITWRDAYERNKDVSKIKAKEYHERNRDKIRERQRNWYKKNYVRKTNSIYRSYNQGESVNIDTIEKMYPDLKGIEFREIHDNVVFKNGVIITRYGRCLAHQLRLSKRCKQKCVTVTLKGAKQEISLAKLLAICFVKNPEGYDRIIFRDGNPMNHNIENLKWGSHREVMAEARLRNNYDRHGCGCDILMNFYKTGDESWINKSFENAYNKVTFDDSHQLKTILYEYFYERALKFKIAYDPLVILINHRKKARIKLKQETFGVKRNLEFVENYEHGDNYKGSLYKKSQKQEVDYD